MGIGLLNPPRRRLPGAEALSDRPRNLDARLPEAALRLRHGGAFRDRGPHPRGNMEAGGREAARFRLGPFHMAEPPPHHGAGQPEEATVNEQERQVIDDIFRRLEQVADQARDPEAERLIADKVRRQPYAPYAMAQAVYVQEQALVNLNAEVEQLRAEVEQLRRQPQGGGFLSGLFGGGSREPEPPHAGSPWGGRTAPYQQPYGGPQQGGMMGASGAMGRGPWGGGMMQQRAGGGFLQSAMATAAGVAGGVMIANALSHAFSGPEASAANDASSLAGLNESADPT